MYTCSVLCKCIHSHVSVTCESAFVRARARVCGGPPFVGARLCVAGWPLSLSAVNELAEAGMEGDGRQQTEGGSD